MTEELKSCSCERCVRAWSEVERMRNLLEDVVNALDLSEIAVETHGPLGTKPAELVKLVLQQKDREIALLRNEPDNLPEWAKEAIKKEFDDTGYLFRDDDTDDGRVYERLLNNILSLRKPKDNAP